MTKKEHCQKESIAYYSGFSGLEIKDVEYGINDYIYCVSGCWYGDESNKSYHKLQVYYDRKGNSFIRLHGYKIPLDEWVRMGV